MPTALSAPVFAALVEPASPFVWPDADGTARGLSLTPLFPRATRLVEGNPALRDLLAIIDALRVGQAREKTIAEQLLRDRLVREHA